MLQKFVKIAVNDELRVQTDNLFHEVHDYGIEGFPFQYYKRYFEWRYTMDTVGWHWHHELEIMLVEKGSMLCKIGEQSILVREGEGIFINSSAFHTVQAPKQEDCCWYSVIVFAPELIAPGTSAIYEKQIKPVLESGADYFILRRESDWQAHMIEHLQRICAICSKEDALTELRIHTELCGLWIEIAAHVEEYRQVPKTTRNKVMQARLRKMLEFIRDHYMDHITTTDIARSANISLSEALRCFRAGVQESPNVYLNQYRLNRAREQLLTTNDSVADIAVSVGFENAGYFDRVFKRVYGVTPKQYIRQEEINSDRKKEK